jgi:hypothetical protein
MFTGVAKILLTIGFQCICLIIFTIKNGWFVLGVLRKRGDFFAKIVLDIFLHLKIAIQGASKLCGIFFSKKSLVPQKKICTHV